MLDNDVDGVLDNDVDGVFENETDEETDFEGVREAVLVFEIVLEDENDFVGDSVIEGVAVGVGEGVRVGVGDIKEHISFPDILFFECFY